MYIREARLIGAGAERLNSWPCFPFGIIDKKRHEKDVAKIEISYLENG